MSSHFFTIAGRRIGPGAPPFMIAELSGNHRGDIGRALRLIDAAKRAGADAVKLQTFTPDSMTLDCDGPGFRIEEGPWQGRTLYDLYREVATPWEWHAELFAAAQSLDMSAFSSPFDARAVDFLESLKAPAYKIASFEIVDLNLIAKAASTGKPIILSTGMADVTEIAEAVKTARATGNRSIALLHCVSGYPSAPEESRLATLPDLAQRFDTVVGLSDHTLTTATAVAGVALGAAIIEKHLTLSRADGGPDCGFSLEPDEFARLCSDCRTAFSACGAADYSLAPSERENRTFRRSLYAVRDIAAGEAFTAENVRSIRPGHGLAPKHLAAVLRCRAARAVKRGEPIRLDALDQPLD